MTSPTIEQQWQERALPPELLERLRKAGISESVLQRMLHWRATPERMELEAKWHETLLEGRIRFRQVTRGDSDAYCDLWANSPEEIGEWDVTVERGPQGFAQFELQERPVINALFDRDVMVATVSFALRSTVVAGAPLSVRFGQAMRVHKDHRRHGYANWVRSLPWAIGIDRITQVQYDYMRSLNLTIARWNSKMMPEVASVPKREDEVPGIPVTVQQYPARARTGTGTGIRTARPGDIERCVALVNRTHAGRDLFRPYTPEFLADRLMLTFPPPPDLPVGWRPPYGLDDTYVYERNGQIIATAALWDRGRDMRERWRHRETGNERTIAVTNLLDIGFADGCEEALAAIIEHLVGVTHALGRDYLVAPMESLTKVSELLADHAPEPETRYLVWRADDPPLRPPAHLDLVYW